MAETLGVSRRTFDRAFEGVAFDPKVVAETQRQAEFTIPIWDYVGVAVSPDRIARGRDKARAVASWLDKASRTYGVDPGVLMGIWGLETDYGASPGTFDVVRSLASLAFVRFRDTYFRDELLSCAGDPARKATSRRARWSDRGPARWARPNSCRRAFSPMRSTSTATDGATSGRTQADAIGSTAHFLAANGWTRDLPWGFEVKLPPGFALADADFATPAPFCRASPRGASSRADGKPCPATGEGRLFMPAGLKGPIFLVTANFDVIKTYNSSTAYALAVALLGDADRSGSSGSGVLAASGRGAQARRGAQPSGRAEENGL